jgi:hypothetical protein
MTGLLRRLRGAVSIGVAWGLLWIAIGMILIALFSVFRPQEIEPGEGPGPMGAIFATASVAIARRGALPTANEALARDR